MLGCQGLQALFVFYHNRNVANFSTLEISLGLFHVAPEKLGALSCLRALSPGMIGDRRRTAA
jgi:hypothetical protein